MKLGIGLFLGARAFIVDAGAGAATEADDTAVGAITLTNTGAGATTEAGDTGVGAASLFNPITDITSATLKCWLNADDGCTVSSWTDLSGVGNNAVQASAPNQGVITAGSINGHATMDLLGGPYMSLDALSAFKDSFSIYSVVRYTGASETGIWCGFARISSGNQFDFMGSITTHYYQDRRNNSGADIIDHETMNRDTNYHSVCRTFSGSADKFWVDGTARASDPIVVANNTVTLDLFSLGDCRRANAQFAPGHTKTTLFMFFSGVLSDADRLTLDIQYARAAYALTTV